MKECTKCKQNKPLSEFHKSGEGFKSRCKNCIKEDEHNRYLRNKEHISKVNRKYVQENRDKINKAARNYYKNNKKACNDKSRRWQSKNKEYVRNWSKERSRKRKQIDPLFKLTCKVRSDIHKILKRKMNNTHSYLGCDFETLINWLNENEYGFAYGSDNLDLDHIIPLSSAKNQEELEKLLHYRNLQLLPSYYNRYIKKDKIFNKIEFEQWLKMNK